MNAKRHGTACASGLLLIGLLVGGQLAAAAHAFSHDPGTGQPGVCAACVAAGQLASGAVDSGQPGPVVPAASVYSTQPGVEPQSRLSWSPRQRAPPLLLPL